MFTTNYYGNTNTWYSALYPSRKDSIFLLSSQGSHFIKYLFI